MDGGVKRRGTELSRTVQRWTYEVKRTTRLKWVRMWLRIAGFKRISRRKGENRKRVEDGWSPAERMKTRGSDSESDIKWRTTRSQLLGNRRAPILLTANTYSPWQSRLQRDWDGVDIMSNKEHTLLEMEINA